MSVGFFIGVRESFIDEAQDAAEALLDAINSELVRLGVAPYEEPRELPDVYEGGLFGRSSLDHDGARLIVELGTRALAARPCPQLELLTQNPYRVVFVPRDFGPPVETRFEDRISDQMCRIWCGSSCRLWEETLETAGSLGIPLAGGVLQDETAHRINGYEALAPGDAEAGQLGDIRTTWLAVHEAARLSVGTSIALSLAG